MRYIIHLLYSNTFRIPVIYFDIYDFPDNIPKTSFTLFFYRFLKCFKITKSDEILNKFIPQKFSNTSINNLPFIVQEVKSTFFSYSNNLIKYHPILGYPTFTLHNCYIKEFLTNLNILEENEESDSFTIISLLSIFLRVFNIDFPLKITESVIFN